MKLLEFEGKRIFQETSILTPKGETAENVDDVLEICQIIGFPLVLKAQVFSGSRGKRGGIKVVENEQEAAEAAEILFEQGLTGEKVKYILIEEKSDIKKEFYLALTTSPKEGIPLLMAIAEGGVDVEGVDDDKICIEGINMFPGLQGFQVRQAVKPWNLEEEAVREVVSIGEKLYKIYQQYDADMVEINPLVQTPEGKMLALDAKIIIDDNALYRQKRYSKSEERYDNELEYRASQHNLNYVKLEGNIGLLCTGAGLTLAALDLISDSGGKAANFLESGGANYENTYHGLELVLSDPAVEVLFINTFGLVSRSDVICRGLADSLKELKPKIPIVASIRGTGEEEARRIFREELSIEPYKTMEEAVKKAVELAR